MNLQFHNGTKALMIGVPKDATHILVDNAMEMLVYKIPNYKNWVTDDVLENPFKIDEYLATKGKEEQWLTTGKRLHGKHTLLGTFTPPSELTFEVKEEWVKWFYGMREEKLYHNYDMFNPKVTIMPAAFLTKEESLASYLQFEITKANLKEKKFVIIEIK